MLRNAVEQDALRDALQLYLVMGSTNCRHDPIDVAEQAICGGVTMLQYREKGEHALIGVEKLALGRQLRELCRAYKIPFIINDDVELAIALNADGMHIGQEDEPLAQVRARIGKDKIIGVSVHTWAEARLAMEQGADYFGIGPIYPTATKLDAKEVQGTILITELRTAGVTIPIVGIGGINALNAEPVITAGADGIAVVSAISMAKRTRENAAELRDIVHSTQERTWSIKQ